MKGSFPLVRISPLFLSDWMRTAKLREISDLLIFLGGLDKSSHCENREILHAIEVKSIVLCLQFIVDKKIYNYAKKSRKS
jgi:hypothetical protein